MVIAGVAATKGVHVYTLESVFELADNMRLQSWI